MNGMIWDEYEKWCTDPYFDKDTRKELLDITDDLKEIEDRFAKRLEFGTGGLRGVIGAGTNRMNVYTVRQATQGLANYIISQDLAKAVLADDALPDDTAQAICKENTSSGCVDAGDCDGHRASRRGVVISYDSRRMSPEFAKEAALCLNANGIRTYLFESLRPTPEMSFALRELGCIAGIMITASHNPREYNGYKVCWEDGAQITPPHDKNIMAEVAKVTDFSMVKTITEEEAKAAGLFTLLGTDIDDRYVAKVKEQCIHPEVIRQAAPDFKIVYTPLNGAGNLPVRRILRELGFENVYVVEEQEQPDGNFPTLAYPNPEEPAAWELALALAKEKDADLVLATDPDADRLGVWVKKDRIEDAPPTETLRVGDAVETPPPCGRRQVASPSETLRVGDAVEYVPFTGNMSGALIAEYLLREKTQMGTLPEHPAVIETIVTTDMLKAIAKAYNVDLIEVLTGFKYIGEQIRIFEQTGSHQFIFGMEESYGALAGTYARDKDAQVAVMLLCEVASWYHVHGKTLCDAMDELYEKYGYYKEGLTSVTKKGLDGAEKIRQIMEHLRKNPPAVIGEMEVLAIRDYSVDMRTERTNSERFGRRISSLEDEDAHAPQSEIEGISLRSQDAPVSETLCVGDAGEAGSQKNEVDGGLVFAGGRVTPTGLPKSNVLYYELENNAWCCVRPSGTEPKIKFYYGVKGSSPDDAEQKLQTLKEACGRLCAVGD